MHPAIPIFLRSFLLSWLVTCACCQRRSAVPMTTDRDASQNSNKSPSSIAKEPNLYAECKTAYAESRLNDAEKACKQAITADPGSAEAHLLLAHTFGDLGKWSEALKEAEDASHMRPAWADPFAVIGTAQQHSGATEEVVRAYKRYLELAPSGRYAADIRTFLDRTSSDATFPADAPLVLPATVTRKGPSRDDAGPDGHSRDRWTSATIFVGMPRAAKTGDTLTVVPVKDGMPSIDLKVTSARAQAATDLTPAIWLIEAETSDSAILTAAPDRDGSEAHPFEAVVVFPARSGAALLPRQNSGVDLPKGIGSSLRTLWCAIDIDGDKRSDVEIFRFCCDKPTKASRSGGQSPCASDCQNTFVRPKGQSWILVDRSSED